MLGRTVEENSICWEPFGARGEKLEFADDFNGAALLLPPLDERSEWLGFEGEPVADRELAEVVAEFRQCLLDGNDGEQVEGRGISAEEWLQEAAPEVSRLIEIGGGLPISELRFPN